MALDIDFRKERVALSKEQTYEALNAYLENAAFITSERMHSQWETWERNLKDSPYFGETYHRVLKEKTKESKERNTLMARLDIKFNGLERKLNQRSVRRNPDQIPEKNKKKTLKQKAKDAFMSANPYLAAGIVGAVITTGIAVAGSAWSAASGADHQFCASVLAHCSAYAGALVGTGAVLTAAHMSLGIAFADKGGKELLEAKEALKNLNYLKTALVIIEAKDKYKNKADTQSLSEQKNGLSPAIVNKIRTAKAYG